MSLELYTKDNCIQCKMTKRFLVEHNINFEERNLSTSPEYINYLKDKGFASVPVLERDSQALISGFRPDLLKQLIAQ
ncbi:glutaredoxin-like protein NrdH [Ligilactobacillus sp. Marseille-Q7487]|jgi:glutaredoxin-like protein NrdH|uniref:glutaredoxin-like protein NrdH n=1 Tax=Ligilactobacillus sp. Marseille-Q7487 TaxID=3022128 RepID=UPI0015B574AE|nr:glutaredoxin-like protein NrdH [Ligilactobacillus sp. Marseille-Q7487]